ncbi:cadherin-like domain-containing protein, partial [Microvirga sp. HBU67558]
TELQIDTDANGSFETVVTLTGTVEGGIVLSSSDGLSGNVIRVGRVFVTPNESGGNNIEVIDPAALDSSYGTDGTDTVLYEGTSTVVLPENVENVMLTGTANSSATGNSLNNTLVGNEGSNTLYAQDGNDTVQGGAGNDTIIGGSGLGDDVYDGGADNDAVTYTSTSLGVTVNLDTGTATGEQIGTDTLTGIENVVGGTGGDAITGNGLANQLTGGDGNDTVTGGAGNDSVDGGAGTDLAVYTGARADYSVEQLGNGSLRITDARPGSPDGSDTVSAVEVFRFGNQNYAAASLLNHPPVTTADAYTVTKSQTLTVAASQGVLANDTDPDGQTLNATLVTGPKSGVLNLGADGAFTYTPSKNFSGIDTFTYTATDNAGGTSAVTTVSIGVVGGGGGDPRPPSTTPTEGDDVLTGTSRADTINGLGGNDRISGLGGDDRLTGGLGNDTFVFGRNGGADVITDFAPGQGIGDRVELPANLLPGVDTFAELQAYISDVNGNAVLSLGGKNAVVFQGVLKAHLAADDFLFI